MGTVLTIAGFDPSGGAGVTADLAVFRAHGLAGTACITALTVQSTLGVAASHPVSPEVVRHTLQHLHADLPPAGIKIGMLATAGCVGAVADYIEGSREGGRRLVVVLDPVLRSTSGRELLEDTGKDLMRTRLLPLVDWITPNLDELAILSGMDPGDKPTRQELERRAAMLLGLLPGVSLMVTGGHLESPDDLVVWRSTAGQEEKDWIRGERIETTSTHGTGCALSSALLARLVLGDEPLEAAAAAKRYVTEALRHASPIGHGHGPMNHLWEFGLIGQSDRVNPPKV